MFDLHEQVCILNNCGRYIPGLFNGYIDDNKCQIIIEEETETVLTEFISNVFKKAKALEDMNREINECHAMIDHFITLNNREEIRCWRRSLQSVKQEKYRLLGKGVNGNT